MCGAEARLFDVVDFHKHCLEDKVPRLPLSGVPIYYARCGRCGFAFSPTMYGWPPEEFRARVYNDDYARFDPEYLETRPAGNARMLQRMFGASRDRLTHLDYGGGNGKLSAVLTADGWHSRSYEPFQDDARPAGRFDLLTAFEVFEHVPDPMGLAATLASLLADEAMIIFSTMLSDGRLKEGARLSWWYAAPRNGHISLFTRQSLGVMARQHGWVFGSINEQYHCFLRGSPAWAGHLIKEAAA